MTDFLQELPGWVGPVYLWFAVLTVLWGLIMYLIGVRKSDAAYNSTMKSNNVDRAAAVELHRRWEVQGARIVLGGAVWPAALVGLLAYLLVLIIVTAVTGRGRDGR